MENGRVDRPSILKFARQSVANREDIRLKESSKLPPMKETTACQGACLAFLCTLSAGLSKDLAGTSNSPEYGLLVVSTLTFRN